MTLPPHHNLLLTAVHPFATSLSPRLILRMRLACDITAETLSAAGAQAAGSQTVHAVEGEQPLAKETTMRKVRPQAG